MFNPDETLEPIMEETKRILKEMQQTKDLEERKSQSEILRNLCQSSAVFLDFISDAMLADGIPDFDENPFLSEND